MTTTEKVKAILDVAHKNGLSLNKKFTDNYLSSHSMFEGPKALADRIVDGMWDMCRHGINNGFDSTCKACVDGLSDIVISLTEIGNEQVGKLSKYTEKADVLLAKEPASRKSYVDVVAPVKQCLQSCIKAVDTMTELRQSGKGFANIDEAQFEMLGKSKDLLVEIASALDGVFDTSSKSAQEKADAAIEKIRVWRDDCVRLICTSASIEKLSDAKQIIGEWVKLSDGVTRRERAKEQHGFSENDELANIVRSKSALEMLDTFIKRMDCEKADISKEKSAIDERKKAKQSERDECKAQLDELENQKAQVLIDAQNGVDIKICNRKIKEIKEKIDDVYYELGKLDTPDQPDFIESEVEMREEVYTALSDVSNVLLGCRNDLGFLAEMVDGVDFTALIDMLGGRTSEKSKNDALSSIHIIYANMSEKLENRRRAVQKLKDDRQIRSEILKTPMSSRRDIVDRVRSAREKYDEEMDSELLAALQNKPEKTEQVGERTVEDIVKNIALTDDDR